MSSAVINTFLQNYVAAALVISLFYGGFAERIFWDEEKRKQDHIKHGLAGHLHQFWLNFFGSVAGWLTLYLFIMALQNVKIQNLTFVHLSFLLVGVVGIVGWLPSMLLGVTNAIASAVAKLIDKV